MFRSGIWRGFWEQPMFGRQPMESFELYFESGHVTGRGQDIIGKFTFRGEYDKKSGQLQMVKQYIGRHQVLYTGKPDGEGSILGNWQIIETSAGEKSITSGPFVLFLDIPKPSGDEPIFEIKK